MASLDEVRTALDKDELDYPRLASELGEGALEPLRELVAEDEPRIASKAAYLAALISGERSDDVVGLASQSRHEVVRVSAAAALSELPAGKGEAAAERLLADPDPGVRARAARSAVRRGDPALTGRVREMARDDEDPAVQELAGELTRDQPGP
jgi:HEAT repeat protein